jgi:Fe-S-cluster containining protein
MGKASRRKAENRALKRINPEQFAQSQDKIRLLHGINPESSDPAVPVAMTRELGALFDEAKRTGNIDPPVVLLYATINATVRGLSDIPVACKKGCSHCCHTWVSVSASEALYTAKIVKQRGDAAIEKVRSAYAHTKQYDFEMRDQHPYPCPLLEEDVCSIYDARPKVCRFAASADAEICARTYHNITNENVPMPKMYLVGRAAYAMVMAAGLQHAGLPHQAYEFTAALWRALETDQAERRWLAGEDIFADIHRDPEDVLSNPQAQLLYRHAFPVAKKG